MSGTRFVTDNFELASEAQHCQLDHEVAARIADVLFFRDEITKSSVGYRDLSFVVDPTGQSLTEPNKFSGDMPLGPENRISFSESLSNDVNQSFAKQMQAVLLERERRDKFPLSAEMAWTAFVVGIPVVSMIGVAEVSSGPGAIISDAMYIGGISTIIGSTFWRADAKRYLRRSVVKPGSILYQRKLAAAEKISRDLKLPPVVSTYN